MGAISKEAVNVPCSQTALKPTPSLCPDDSFNTLGWILGTEPFFTVSPLSLKSYFVSVIFIQSLNPVQLCDHGLQHARSPCPSPTPCPLSRWCHPTISSSVVPFSSCLQSFPAPGPFETSQFFASVAKGLELQLQHQSFQRALRFSFKWNPLSIVGDCDLTDPW